MYNQGGPWYPPPHYFYPHSGGGGNSDTDAVLKLLDFLEKRNKPLPSSTDLDKYLKLMERLERKEEKKKKDEEEKKKKDKDKDGHKVPMFSGIQVFLILMAFGAPVGFLWLKLIELLKVAVLN